MQRQQSATANSMQITAKQRHAFYAPQKAQADANLASLKEWGDNIDAKIKNLEAQIEEGELAYEYVEAYKYADDILLGSAYFEVVRDPREKLSKEQIREETLEWFREGEDCSIR